MPAPYYKLNKGFFHGFLFKPLGGLPPPRGLNKKALKKYPLFITYYFFSRRFDLISLNPDGPEDEAGIKKASEMCKYSTQFSELFFDWDVKHQHN